MKMVEVKTAELIGPALDWAVTLAAYGREPWQLKEDTLGTWYAGEGSGGIKDWQPSTDWAQCGPLIEKYKLRLVPCDAGYFSYTDHMAFEGIGESALIAACRAIVASKLGDVVSVPAELVNGGGL